MTEDEDALRWAGDEDRGQEPPRRAASTASPGVSDPEASDAAVAPPGRGVIPAVFAVPYLALTLGWILAVRHTSSGTGALATEILWQFGEFLAIVAAPLWFGTVIALTRDSRGRVRVGWLALGIAVLIPWPLVLAGIAAAVTA